MTARDDLVFRLTNGAGLSPAWAQRQIDAYRTDVLREAAAKIRDRGYEDVPHSLHDIVEQLANLIDPDKEPS